MTGVENSGSGTSYGEDGAMLVGLGVQAANIKLSVMRGAMSLSFVVLDETITLFLPLLLNQSSQ